MAMHNKLGADGESIAVDYLKANGYKVIARNWRVGHLEVDIIAELNSTIVFVEVKTRSTNFFGDPHTFVSIEKQKNIVAAANEYLQQNQLDMECRFDIIGVVMLRESHTTNHFVDAFYPLL